MAGDNNLLAGEESSTAVANTAVAANVDPASPSPKHTVIVIRTSSVARIPVYERILEDLPVELVVVHPVVNESFARFFKHWLTIDTNDVNTLEREVRIAMKELHFDPIAVISFDEYGVYPGACLAVRLGLRPLPLPPAALEVTTVKSAFRKHCATFNINAPRSATLRSVHDDVEALLTGIEFPVVVKPSPGAGSMFARKCESLAELQDYLPAMWDAVEHHPDARHFECLGQKIHILVEEYIGGQEVDIDCFVSNGKILFSSISDNLEVLPPYFLEQGGVTPSLLPAKEQEALQDLLQSFVTSHGDALHGVLHFEAKYDFGRNKAFVIEVNCRMGSAETNTMLTTVYGVHLGSAFVRQAIGLPLSESLFNSKPSCYCSSANVYADQTGVVDDVQVPNGSSLVSYSWIGGQTAPPPQSFKMIYWMVAKGSTPQLSAQALDRLRHSSKVHYQSSLPTEQ